MENIGYILLAIVTLCWIIAMIVGLIVAFPYGIIGLVAIIGIGFLAGLRTLIGGEITEYTKMLAESREQAIDRMTADATSLCADAIVCARFVTSPVMQGAAELLAYGTAVTLKEK